MKPMLTDRLAIRSMDETKTRSAMVPKSGAPSTLALVTAPAVWPMPMRPLIWSAGSWPVTRRPR